MNDYRRADFINSTALRFDMPLRQPLRRALTTKPPVCSPGFVLTTYLRIQSIRVAAPSHAHGDTGR
jgi:hypothetical protein